MKHQQHHRWKGGNPTFSCFKCFNSFSSLYVLFDKTGVLKGFMIFLTATFWPVRLSLAELRGLSAISIFAIDSASPGYGFSSYQTRPKAPMPTGCKSEYLQDNVSCELLERAPKGGEGRLPRGVLTLT